MLKKIIAWLTSLDRPLVYVHSYRDGTSIFESLFDKLPYPTDSQFHAPFVWPDDEPVPADLPNLVVADALVPWTAALLR